MAKLSDYGIKWKKVGKNAWNLLVDDDEDEPIATVRIENENTVVSHCEDIGLTTNDKLNEYKKYTISNK